MSITRIVLTGGPCAGKSTGLAVIEQKLKSMGYKVVIMSEMATNVLSSGITPMEIGVDFQDMLIKLQLDRDNTYQNILDKMCKTCEINKVAIIYDRGLLDGKAYCKEEEFIQILSKYNLNHNEVMAYYDGVFHLVTAADGAAEFYTKENNTVRMESPSEAIEADRKTLNSWIGHPHLRVITNKGVNFEQKIDKLMGEILMLLGEPVPLEIERKYLIKMPNIKEIESKVKLNKSEIVQTYLIANSDGAERRVRQRGTPGDYSYYYTEKLDISSGTREEKERRITEKEYLTLLMEADTSKHQIRKTRYCFVYGDRYFELDVYPFWNDKAILEIEVNNLEEKIKLPDFIDIIKEVTDDKNYKNSSLAITTEVD